MTLRLHDTASRSLRDFTPLIEGKVSIYVCGATVQGSPHIGHARSAVCFDILRRWLEFEGLDVTLIRNVTDIDDKILTKSADADIPWWAWAYTHEQAFEQAFSLLGVLPPAYAPRATGHVPEMVDMMQRLIDTGHAYANDGNVYFDVASWADYGELSRQSPDEMRCAEGPEEAGKRNPRDFALWKASRPGEPAWETPWGTGRPGWHLECSAMAAKYCGAEFDIHGGGIDLVFPHHENELAQSHAAGDPFARYWLHNNWVTTAGEKMSKSLGNSLLVEELAQHVRPIELRYYLGAAHYRSVIEYSPASLAESAAGFGRIESFLTRASDRLGDIALGDKVDVSFRDALNDDLAVPAALATLHESITEGNKLLDSGSDEPLLALAGRVRRMASILGVDSQAEHWASAAPDDQTHAALNVLVTNLLAQRSQARESQDYATADAVRDNLAAAGIEVSDGSSSSRWSLKHQQPGNTP